MARALLSRLRAPLSGLRAFVADRGGTALIEFAVALPVLLLMYLGCHTISDLIACNRKVTITTRTLTDLATRYPALTEADAQQILNASAQVMYPYKAGNATIVLSEVKVTSSNQALVVWSRALNGVALTSNTYVPIPDGMAATNTFMILGQVRYDYQPPSYLTTFNTAMTLSDTILMIPRVSDEVPIS